MKKLLIYILTVLLLPFGFIWTFGYYTIYNSMAIAEYIVYRNEESN